MREWVGAAEPGYRGWAGRTKARAYGVQTAAMCAVETCCREANFHFQGRGACSGRCLELLMRDAVIEEQVLATVAAFRARPHVQLGRILVEQGAITEAQLERALRSQKAAGAGKLGSWLKQQMALPDLDLTAALSSQWRCPVFRAHAFLPGRMSVYLPRPLVEEHGVLPLCVGGSPERLALGFEGHIDYEIIQAAERMHGIKADAGLLPAHEFWQSMRDLLAVPFARVHQVRPSSHDVMIAVMSRLLARSAAANARLVAVHGCFWLRFWSPASGERRSAQPVVHDLLCTPYHALPRRDAQEQEEEVAGLLRDASGLLE